LDVRILCGFYPGPEPGQHQYGVAEAFEAARADFEAAWQSLLPNLKEAAFDEYRHHCAWTTWKYKMWGRGGRMLTQEPDGRSFCFCGAAIDTASVDEHVRSAHMDQV
jgi:hypothetical protein